MISKTANTLARYLLGIPTHEATTSFRGFSLSLLKEMPKYQDSDEAMKLLAAESMLQEIAPQEQTKKKKSIAFVFNNYTESNLFRLLSKKVPSRPVLRQRPLKKNEYTFL